MTRGVPNASSGHDTVRETHSPRKRCGPAIVAVAGEKTANSPDSVACGSGRRTRVEKFEQRNLCLPRQKDQRNESTQKAAKPGKSDAAEDVGPRIRKKSPRAFQDMVEARTGYSREPGDTDDQECIGLKSPPLEIGIQDVCGAKKRRRNHQAECGKRQGAEV